MQVYKFKEALIFPQRPDKPGKCDTRCDEPNTKYKHCQIKDPLQETNASFPICNARFSECYYTEYEKQTPGHLWSWWHIDNLTMK